MIAVDCPDVAATRAVAAALALLLEPGDVILLDGDLGAGKTTFTQGLAQALGVPEAVTSPTFTLLKTYPTTAGFDLCHVDVYRLEKLSEVEALAIPEALDDGAVAVIEWGTRAAGALAPDYLRITIEMAGSGDGRRLAFESVGPRWTARMPMLVAPVARS